MGRNLLYHHPPENREELTLLRAMECSIKFDTVIPGWSFVYIEGLQVKIFKKNLTCCTLMDFPTY